MHQTPAEKQLNRLFLASLLRISFFIGLVDGLIIFLLHKVAVLNQFQGDVISISLLVLISSPILLFVVLRPLVERITQQQKITTEQIRVNAELRIGLDAHALVSITDANGRIIYANEKFCKLSGYSNEELLGKDHRIISSGYHNKAFMASIWETITQGHIWQGQLCNRSKSGQLYWVDSTIMPLLDEMDAPYQYISIRHDITAQVDREALEQRDQEDTQARLAIANTLYQPAPFKERCLSTLSILFNIQSLQLQQKGGLFLKTEDEHKLHLFALQGNFSDEFIEKEQCVNFGDCLCGRAALSGEILISDDCFCDPRHEHQFTNMKAHGHYIIPLVVSGNTLGVLFLFTDPYPVKNESRLTMLKQVGDMLALAILQEQTKKELEQARDLALQAALVKNEFLANMSHEIRTPMNGVLGMLDILRDSEMSSDQSELVETAYTSTEALLAILNDILDFSKLEAGRVEIETIDFNLVTLIEEVCSLLAVPAFAKGLELNCFVPIELPNYWMGDPNRIRQVLTNLISNAIKFTELGDVSVTVSYETDPDGKATLFFKVQDTGIGISPETQARLFQTFTQADSSTSRRFGGTGLGLSISKILVELMNGTIGVDSELGKGACFWFSLPLEPIKDEILLPALINLKDKRALVVDDNANNRMILEHYVSSWGMTVSSVDHASAALVTLIDASQGAKPFDILLSDLQMPFMDGLSLARMICEIPTIANTPRLLLSSGGIGSEANYKALGFSQCLIKPVRQTQLFDAIVKAFQPVKPLSETPVNTETEAISNKEVWSDYSNKRVLVAEDNSVNRKVILAMLARFNLKPDLVENGQLALDRLAQQNYDLVLMDCQMPIMGGYEATTKLREKEQSTNSTRTPVIALTAHATLEARETSLASGMDGHLSKPINRTELADVLARWLEPVATDKSS